LVIEQIGEGLLHIGTERNYAWNMWLVARAARIQYLSINLKAPVCIR